MYLVVYRPGADHSRSGQTCWPAAEPRLAGGSPAAVLGDTAAIRHQVTVLGEALDEIDQQPAAETRTLATDVIRQLSPAGT